MPRKRSPLPVQVLLFLLVTLLGVAISTLTNSTGALPWGLELLRQQALPLAGVTMLLIIGVMVWQHWTEQRLALPAWSLGWQMNRICFAGRNLPNLGCDDQRRETCRKCPPPRFPETDC